MSLRLRDEIGCALVLCLVAAVSLLYGQQVLPLPPGPNLVAGRVLDMSSNAPIPAAAVTLTSINANAVQARLEGIVAPLSVRNVLTSADGSFVFREVQAGRYSLAVTAFGYEHNDYPQTLIDVQDGAKPATMTVRVWKHAAISGRVTDERGEPVVGLSVYAFRRLSIGGSITLRREYVDAATDDRGVYRIASLRPGSYVVGVMPWTLTMPANLAATVDAVASNRTAAFNLSSQLGGASIVRSGEGLRQGDLVFQRAGPPPVLTPDGRVLTYWRTLFPGTASAAEATLVRLASGESRGGVDIPVRFQPGWRVSGQVTGPNGPLTNVAVRLVAPDVAESSSLESLGESTAITDGNGRFTFLGIAPGTYSVKAALYKGTSTGQPDTTALWAEQLLTVGDTSVEGVEVTLRGGAGAQGRVEFRGTPPDASERMFISLRPIAAESWMSLRGEVRPDGTFTTGASFPGRYELYGGSAGWHVTEVTQRGKTLGDYIIELGPDGTSDLVVTLSKASRRVSGTVSDAQGLPDLDANILVFPADTVLWREGIFHSRRVRLAPVSAAGAFEFIGLARGEYYVVAVNARLASEWQDPGFLERVIPGAIKISVADGDDKTAALRTFTPRAR